MEKKKQTTHDHEIFKHLLDWENDMLRYGDEGPVVEKGDEDKFRPPSKNQDGNT